MGGSSAEEEKRRTGGTQFDRIWNSLFAMKDVRPQILYYVYCMRYVSVSRYTLWLVVVTQPRSFIMHFCPDRVSCHTYCTVLWFLAVMETL